MYSFITQLKEDYGKEKKSRPQYRNGICGKLVLLMNRKTFLEISTLGIGAALGLPKIASAKPVDEFLDRPGYRHITSNYNTWQEALKEEDELIPPTKSLRHLLKHKGLYALYPAIKYNQTFFVVVSRGFDSLDSALAWANKPNHVIYTMMEVRLLSGKGKKYVVRGMIL